MTDDELDRHLMDILTACMGDPPSDAGLSSARSRLRLAIDMAIRAEREACKAIADACARERANAANDAPIVGTPERTQIHQWLRCKQSEAERIAESIAKAKKRSNTP